MHSNLSLKDKVVFLTGASRGIGRAIAERLAADGAKLILAAKTLERHEKLPGSLQETAAAVQAAGGQALPVRMDVRDEASVHAAVAQGVAHFGGIDICINNAGAFHMQASMQTPIKRHDLLFDVNARGCLISTQACYPHLQAAARQGRNPHVLSLAPPLDIRGVWFEHTSCYSVSKYAMSLYTLGWAREFAADGIAANCLWPRTGIESPAAIVHGGEDLRGEFRSPRIRADAAHAILSQPASYTGQFCIDDSTLAALAGVSDFDAYSVQAGAALVPDYFVPAQPPAPAGVKLSRFRLYDLGADHPPMG